LVSELFGWVELEMEGRLASGKRLKEWRGLAEKNLTATPKEEIASRETRIDRC